MSTSLHAVFNLVSGNIYFVIGIFNIHGQKTRFSESTQNSVSEKSILGHFGVFFSQRINFSQGGGGFFLLVPLSKSILTKRWALWLVSKKAIQFSAKVPILAIFDYLGPHSKSVFSTYRLNFEKSTVNFVGEVVKNIVLNFGLSIFKKRRGGLAVLQVDIFQNPWF